MSAKWWSHSGTCQRLFEPLAREADNEYILIDSTIVRAQQHSAGAKGRGYSQGIGRSRGGLSTKIHAAVDALGNPTGFHLTPRQAHDLERADVLLADTKAQTVVADKSHGAQARVVEPLLSQGKGVVIASRSTRKMAQTYDRHLHQARHLRRQDDSQLSSSPLHRWCLGLA